VRKSKKDSSVTVRFSHELKTGIKRLSEDMNLDQSELLRRVVYDALCRAKRGELVDDLKTIQC
jgi:hypothetical protein